MLIARMIDPCNDEFGKAIKEYDPAPLYMY